jgi:hypothetical protein
MADTIISENTGNIVSTVESNGVVNTASVDSVLVNSEFSTYAVVSTTDTILVESSTTNVVVTGLVGPQGQPGVPEEDLMYSKRVDFISETELYKGEAAVGSSENSGVWRVRKIVLGVDGDMTETWADGTALFDKVWADRASLIYS